MSKFSCVLVVFSILLLLKEATADQIPITVLPSVAMVPVPGSPGLFALVPIDVPVTGTHFNGNDGRMGCTKKYDYSKFTAGPTWPVNHMGRAYVEADVIRYWDWTYDGYDREGGGSLDFTQNCHGFPSESEIGQMIRQLSRVSNRIHVGCQTFPRRRLPIVQLTQSK